MPRFDSRLGCSTISFRHQPLPEALATIAGLGFSEIDLGALPGVCDHVPYVLDMAAVEDVARTVIASGLQVRSINGDIGDLNVPLADGPRAGRQGHLDMLVALAVATDARALVLPCGAIDHTPVDDARGRRRAGRRRTRVGSRRRRLARRRAVDRVAAPPPAVLEPRTCAAAHRSPSRPRRDRHGLQPRRRLRRRPGRVRRPLRTAHRTRPHPRRRTGQHQPLGRPRHGRLSPEG